MPLLEQLELILEKRKRRDLLRSLVVASPSSIDFSSNDFLGLARNKLLQKTYLKELSSFPNPPLGSTGSRLLDGNSSYAESLDKFIAEFHKAESALIFPSGFDANVGLFSSVPQHGDAIIIDEFIHASVHDGIRNSRAAVITKFRHNDIKHLKKVLETVVQEIEPQKNIFIAVESLYSMDGDIAPLNEIVEVIKPFNSYLIVDEAHATGVYGEQGRGIVCELGLERKVFARLHTFGKALASNGAAIVGPKLLRSYLINYARPLIFSTFLSFNSLIAIDCSYKVMTSEAGNELRKRLMRLIHLFRSNIDFPSNMLLPSNSAIQGILIPGNDNVVKLCRVIQNAGYNVKPIRSPTVPVGKERVRVCIHADNTEEQILGLINVIKDYFIQQNISKEMNNYQIISSKL
ncbi:serine C-palmitoyltransferase LCB2 [Rhizophagus irregularis DAOM 197198w]|uniref:Serine C-palmitoyltransferase LCB2 n=1 Tax=Rhizophagus irregularis (strain DAOM 197198w) TaxID=1432141 RepID=A0A015LWE0_RHIIW|nr:serine C-palmitoyltransferase LCB2 [Rhizophagus irregularis DAOM 197198w]